MQTLTLTHCKGYLAYAMNDPIQRRKLGLAMLIRMLWTVAFILSVLGAQAGVVFTTLHSFQFAPYGANPQAGLVRGSDGDIYGTTALGGTYNGGTVFKISSNGMLTNLYYFTGGNDGANPLAGLVQGRDGNYYGTTSDINVDGAGTVFKISTNGALTTLYGFTDGNDGDTPEAGLVQGSDGNFYGTTSYGGPSIAGTIFKISTDGTFTNLYSFTGGNDGSGPSGLVQGNDGNFYGTTFGGGTNDSGTVFKISSGGVLTSLYSFTGGNDGDTPQAGLVQGSDGYLYGTTGGGGANSSGTVFRISTNGTLTPLYSFTGGNDGAQPSAALVQGSDGHLYGTTYAGGTNHLGTVFQISTNGALASLCSFSGTNNGANPQAGLVQGSAGNFYGTTYYGGSNNLGAVFQISINGVLTRLYSFIGNSDGANPQVGLVQGSDGYLYGTTFYGGSYGSGYAGNGSVFKISTNGALTSLYSFPPSNYGPDAPVGLVQGSDGYFYGMTTDGGFGLGTVFKISAIGVLTNLYTFIGVGDGKYPQAGLARGSDGNLYGTTSNGGDNDFYGTVFKISTNGTLVTLYSFTGGNDGGNPGVELVLANNGSFYGTTFYGGTNGVGTVFQIRTNGVLTSLYSFGAFGTHPNTGLVQGSDGYFYGLTFDGGQSGLGTVFKISAEGVLTNLHSFAGGKDGGNPQAGLAQGSDGSFYGTTLGGGSYDSGTVFKINTNGILTTLYSFTGGNDGANPQAGLVQGRDGSFYGTTYSGGQGGVGTVFQLTIAQTAPQLTITLSRPNVILSWPLDATGFTLESTTNLASQAWSTVVGQFTVTNAIAGSRKFYRLSQ
jgi:uncharacterized repeat protein (TIGR03803 family)